MKSKRERNTSSSSFSCLCLHIRVHSEHLSDVLDIALEGWQLVMGGRGSLYVRGVSLRINTVTPVAPQPLITLPHKLV